jgi:hypothetical protein
MLTTQVRLFVYSMPVTGDLRNLGPVLAAFFLDGPQWDEIG